MRMGDSSRPSRIGRHWGERIGSKTGSGHADRDKEIGPYLEAVLQGSQGARS